MTGWQKLAGLAVGGVALVGAGFLAGRTTAPPPEGWLDITKATDDTRQLLTMPGALDFLGQIIHVEDGQIKLYNAMEAAPELAMPDGYPAWPGHLPIYAPKDGTRWMDVALPGGEALAAAKDRWVIVNLWATWCAPCVAELPDFNILAAELDPDKVGVFLINADPQKKDTPAAIKAMFDQKGYANLVPLVAEGDAVQAVLQAAGMDIAAYPTTLIYAPGGKPFAYVHGAGENASGWATPETMAFFKALGEMPAPG